MNFFRNPLLIFICGLVSFIPCISSSSSSVFVSSQGRNYVEVYGLQPYYVQRDYHDIPIQITWKLRYNSTVFNPHQVSSLIRLVGYEVNLSFSANISADTYYSTTVKYNTTTASSSSSSLSSSSSSPSFDHSIVLSVKDILHSSVPEYAPYVWYSVRMLTYDTMDASEQISYTSFRQERIYIGPGRTIRDWAPATDWICSDPSTATDTRATYIVTNFGLPSKTIASATLYITGMGQFYVSINGISSGETNVPGQTSWAKRVLYSTYSIVPSLLFTGQNNTIGIVLGNGMYNVPSPSNGRYTKWVGSFGPRMVLVNFNIVFNDGTMMNISSSSVPNPSTNTVWYATDNGPITFSHEYAGEDYNQTLDITGWNLPGNNIITLNPFVTWSPVMNCTGSFPGGLLYPSTFDPVKVMDMLPVVSLVSSQQQSILVTLERNFAGFASVTVNNVPYGYGVRVWPSETAYNNNIDQSSGGTPMYWQYLPNASATGNSNETQTVTVQPLFSTYGWRWLEVQLLPVTQMQYTALSPHRIMSNPYESLSTGSINGTVTVLQASYGVNCNVGLVGDETTAVGNFCNGQSVCNYTVCVCGDNTCNSGDPPCIPDPAQNCAKDFSVVWSCSKDPPGTNRSWYIPAEADNQLVLVTCGPMPPPPPPPVLPNVTSAMGHFTRSSVPTVGTWSSSNDWINRIHNITLEAIFANLQSVLTDCPHRERLGWLEVSHLMFPSIAYNVDISKLWSKIALDTIDTQLSDGMVPDIAPEYTVFSGGFRDSPEWGSASIQNPYFLYKWYGNIPIIQQTFTTGMNYINYLITKRDPSTGLLAYGLNDWIPVVTSPMGVTGTAIFIQDLYAWADVAVSIFNNQTLADTYLSLANELINDYNTAFWNGTAYPTQCAAGMALFLNMTNGNNRTLAQNYLLQDVISRGNVTTAGEIGNRYVLQALGDIPDGISAVYNSFLRTTSPGYGWMLTMNETALAESWFDAQGDSHIHAMYGHCDEFLYKYIAGIQMVKNNWERIAIVPQVLPDLDWLNVSFDSPRGLIRIQWNRTTTTTMVGTSNGNNGTTDVNKGEQIHIKTQIPPGSTGYIVLPLSKQQVELNSGIEHFFIDE